MKKLLQLLEDDCTLTHAQLASLANMPEADVAAAIKKYEEDKVILGYKAIVDWDRTDRESVTALIEVKVTPQRGEGFDRVAERIYQYDEVESVYHERRLRPDGHHLGPYAERGGPVRGPASGPPGGCHRHRHPLYLEKIQRKAPHF